MAKSPKAVALKYNGKTEKAPRVVAKGTGNIAQKIIEIAKEHKVTLCEDKNLVQVLAALDLETEIPAELYRAVAEVLALVYRLNGRIRS